MCKRPAEWVLFGDGGPDGDTYSCTRHLSWMVADDTHLIELCDPDDGCGRCCYVSWWQVALASLREFMQTMWWDVPLDWDEQVREAVGDE